MERVMLAAAGTRESFHAATPRVTPVVASREKNSILRLQRSIGNRGVQRLLLLQAAPEPLSRSGTREKTVQRAPVGRAPDRTPPAPPKAGNPSPPTVKPEQRPPKAAGYDAIISRLASMIERDPRP